MYIYIYTYIWVKCTYLLDGLHLSLLSVCLLTSYPTPIGCCQLHSSYMTLKCILSSRSSRFAFSHLFMGSKDDVMGLPVTILNPICIYIYVLFRYICIFKLMYPNIHIYIHTYSYIHTYIYTYIPFSSSSFESTSDCIFAGLSHRFTTTLGIHMYIYTY
jgi:hypothetical protein